MPANAQDRVQDPNQLDYDDRTFGGYNYHTNVVIVPVVAAPRRVAGPSAPAPLAPVEIERSLAWQNGRLVFESAPLSAIVEEFNRYSRRPLVIADEELGARRFGGTFVATDPNTFAELLRTSYDVVVEDRADGITLRRRR